VVGGTHPQQNECEDVMDEEPVLCAHCGQPRLGKATYNTFPLCHPLNGEERPDCYTLVSREHHHMPCDKGCA
jgi:hypothetical protein